MTSEHATMLTILSLFIVGMGFVNWKMPLLIIGVFVGYLVIHCLIKLFYIYIGFK